MEFSKHKNHRNPNYLSWLRKQPCVVSGEKADCAHHIRIGTNGGSALKPSDYFCIPLINEYHTTGLFAIHIVGEETFLSQFQLKRNKLFIKYLKNYLIEEFDIYVQLEDQTDEALIAYMINLVEKEGPEFQKTKKIKKSKKKDESRTKENEFYEKVKEAKKIQAREVRLELKQKEALKPKKKSDEPKKKALLSLKGNEFYEKSKEFKRQKDKELRSSLKKEESPKAKKKYTKKVNSVKDSEFYQKSKELKKKYNKELRMKLKLEQKEKTPEMKASQSEFYQKAKELKRKRDKELRDEIKAEKKRRLAEARS